MLKLTAVQCTCTGTSALIYVCTLHTLYVTHNFYFIWGRDNDFSHLHNSLANETVTCLCHSLHTASQMQRVENGCMHVHVHVLCTCTYMYIYNLYSNILVVIASLSYNIILNPYRISSASQLSTHTHFLL